MRIYILTYAHSRTGIIIINTKVENAIGSYGLTPINCYSVQEIHKSWEIPEAMTCLIDAICLGLTWSTFPARSTNIKWFYSAAER